jgi:hypothetical protein
MTTAGVLALAAAPAFAGTNDDQGQREEDESAVAATASVTLGQAISMAESSTGGRAFRASYAFQNGTSIVQVDLVKDEAARQALRDPEPALDRGQHQHVRVRGQATAVEGDPNRLAGDR